MQKRFNIIFFLLLNLTLFSEEVKTQKDIFIIKNFNQDISEKNIIFFNSVLDYIEETIVTNFEEIKIIMNNNQIESNSIRQISNYVLFNYGSGFFYIDMIENEKQLQLDVNLYNYQGELLSKKHFYFEKEKMMEFLTFKKNDYDDLIDFFINSISLLPNKKTVTNIRFRAGRSNYKHDFPTTNICLTAVSSKFYFDSRTNSKIFSFFPVQLLLTFFPSRYFEIGLFIKFDFDDMIYKYYNKNLIEYDYFHSSFNFIYGIFAGLSFFFDIYHFSMGGSFYNIFYYIPERLNWKKTEDYRSYFLPQFSFYNKLDIKLFKVLSYSIYFVIKTIPEFIYENNYFYSEPFKYDFIVVEFSLLGFSITF